MYKEKIRKAVKRHDTGRWDWISIDACLTGEDSDLEPWGQQGVEILEANESYVSCVVHIGKTVAGIDARLNPTPSVAANYVQYSKLRNAYLDRACEIISQCGIPSDWNGKEWYLYRRTSFPVRWKFNREREVDFRKTAGEILLVAKDKLKPIEDELERLDDFLASLAGWKTYDKENGRYLRCREFEPGPESVSCSVDSLA